MRLANLCILRSYAFGVPPAHEVQEEENKRGRRGSGVIQHVLSNFEVQRAFGLIAADKYTS